MTPKPSPRPSILPMLRKRRWQVHPVLLGAAAAAALVNCDGAAIVSRAGDGGVATASRSLRGAIPTRLAGAAVSRLNVVNAATGRTVATATPNAQGQFTLNNVPRGATYRLTAQAGNQAVPLVFPRQQGTPAAKTNLFNVGTRTDPRVGTLDGPIELGELATLSIGDETQVTPANAANAPNLQEDFDNDGMPDGVDTDDDGDGVADEMDNDDNGDGVPDATQFGDQDDDGITNESDPDADGDGTPNSVDDDNDNDGVPDAMDSSPNGDARGTAEDSDGDGVPNAEDSMDPDDNEVPEEAVEDVDGGLSTPPVVGLRTGMIDTNGDGTMDGVGYDADGDGRADTVDTDGDGDVDGADNDGDGRTTMFGDVATGAEPLTSEQAALSVDSTDPDFDRRLDPMNPPMTADPMTGEVTTPSTAFLPGVARLRALSQGRQLSCSAFAVSAAATILRWGREGGDINTLWPSPAFLYARGLAGNPGPMVVRCPTSGTFINEVLNTLVAEGAPSLSELPYSDRQCPQTPKAGDLSYRYRIGGYQLLRPFTRANGREALAAGYPLVFGVSLPQNFRTQLLDSRLRSVRTAVFRGTGTCGGSAHCGGHAMVIVGYDDARGAFRVLNSWGTDFGDGGYFWWDYENLASRTPDVYAVTPPPGAPEPFITPDGAAFTSALSITNGAVLTPAPNGRWYLTFRLRLREPARLTQMRVTPLKATTPFTQSYAQWVSYGSVRVNFPAQPTAGMARVEMDFTLFDDTRVQVVRTLEIPAPESDADGMD